jgi:hypothetical protein
MAGYNFRNAYSQTTPYAAQKTPQQLMQEKARAALAQQAGIAPQGKVGPALRPYLNPKVGKQLTTRGPLQMTPQPNTARMLPGATGLTPGMAGNVIRQTAAGQPLDLNAPAPLTDEQKAYNDIMARLDRNQAEGKALANMQGAAEQRGAAYMGAQAGYTPFGAASAQLMSGAGQRALQLLMQNANKYNDQRAELEHQRWQNQVSTDNAYRDQNFELQRLAALTDPVPEIESEGVPEAVQGADIGAGKAYASPDTVNDAFKRNKLIVQPKRTSSAFADALAKGDAQTKVLDDAGYAFGQVPTAELSSLISKTRAELGKMSYEKATYEMRHSFDGIVAGIMWNYYVDNSKWPSAQDVIATLTKMGHIKTKT